MIARTMVLVPSRRRPENAHRLMAAFDKTRVLDDTYLVFVLDSDDETTADYPGNKIIYHPSQRRGIVDPLNKAALGFEKYFDTLGFMGDDHIFRTRGWDEAVSVARYDQASLFVYGNDLLQGENLPTACFVSSGVVKTLGYMAPPVLQHLYVDNFWRDMGRALGSITYMPDVIIEHLHFSNQKSAEDQTYRECNSVGDLDKEAYAYYTQNDFWADMAKLDVLLR